MMRQSSQDLAEGVLVLNQIQVRTVTSLLTEHDCLKKYSQKVEVYKHEPISKLCNEEKESAYHVVSVALTH